MPKTLLLADDSVTIQKVVGITFANEDVRLITESNGDAALARAREDAPDLVLADVAMPGLNGYELCAAIKADPRLSHVPVILLTGTFESYDESRTAEVGADGHISKPFEAQALVDLVHRTLERVARGERAPRPQAAAPAAPEPLELEPEIEAPPAAPQQPAPAQQPAAVPQSQRPQVQPPQAQPPQAQPPQAQPPQAPAPQVRPPAPQPAQQPPRPAPAQQQPAAPPQPAASPPARPAEMDFSFSDFGQELSSPAPQPSGEVTQFYDPLAERAGAQDAPKDSPATLPPSDQANPMLEETSFLDPRAPSEPLGRPAPTPAAAPPPRAPAPAHEVPEIEAPRSSPNPLAPSAAPELDVFDAPAVQEAPGVPSLRTPSEDRSQTTGETTWQLTETPSQPSGAPSAAALAAERALDDLPGSERIVHASPDETSSDIAWAEPIEDGAGAPKAGQDAEAVREAASFGPATLAGRPPVQVDSKQLQDTLEKLAWEAFGPVSEQLVGEALKKIEEVAWEVIPQIAERLVREEIAKLKKS